MEMNKHILGLRHLQAGIQFIIHNFKFIISSLEVQKLGNVNTVYLTGDLARGLETPIIDITLIGKNIDGAYLTKLVQKAEDLIERRIRTLVFQSGEDFVVEEPRLLIYGKELSKRKI